jgi:hypothetical protein
VYHVPKWDAYLRLTALEYDFAPPVVSIVLYAYVPCTMLLVAVWPMRLGLKSRTKTDRQPVSASSEENSTDSHVETVGSCLLRTAVFLTLAATVAWLAFDSERATVLAIDYHARHRRWDDVLKAAARVHGVLPGRATDERLMATCFSFGFRRRPANPLIRSAVTQVSGRSFWRPWCAFDEAGMGGENPSRVCSACWPAPPPWLDLAGGGLRFLRIALFSMRLYEYGLTEHERTGHMRLLSTKAVMVVAPVLLLAAFNGCSWTEPSVLEGTWVVTVESVPDLEELLLTFDATGNIETVQYKIGDNAIITVPDPIGTTSVDGNTVTISVTFNSNTLAFNGTLNEEEDVITGSLTTLITVGAIEVKINNGPATLTKQ